MRIAYFLSGMPGSGKSTLISKNELDALTLSLDSFRKLYSGLTTDYNGNITMSQDQNDFVYNKFIEALEFRLQLGSPIIIDNLNPSLKDIKEAVELINSYDYEYKIVEFPLQNLDFYINRNNGREIYKRLPETTLTALHSVFKLREFDKNTIISTQDFEKEICATPADLIKDFSSYNKIHFFGDLQGCFSSLEEYLKKEKIKSNELYIFLGDYIDRGIENAKCLDFLLTNINKPNFIFIMGNHEENLYRYSNNLKKTASPDFINNTLPDLINSNIDKEKMKEVYRGLKLFEFIKYNEKNIFISHAGLSSVPQRPRMLNYSEYLRGFGPYTYNVDEQFDKLNKDNEWYQIHGHRNHNKLTFNSYKKSFTLESDVEFGGNLSILRLDKNGFNGVYIQNKIFNKDLITKIEEDKKMFKIVPVVNNLNDFLKSKVNSKKTGLDIINELRSKDFIKENTFKEYPHISSFSLIKDNFHDDILINSKEFLFNNKNGEIIARSFEKFLNINELIINSENLENTLTMPIELYQKEDGFLGIIGYDSTNNSLIFSSKNNIGFEFSKKLENIIKQQLTDGEIEYLKIFANRHNVNYLFEVNDQLNYHNIIENEKQNAVLLSVVKRDLRYSEMNYSNLVEFSESFKNLPVKNKFIELNNFKSFNGFFNAVNKESAFTTKRQIEGYVVQDNNLNMGKIQLPFYNFWKSMYIYTQEINKSEFQNKDFDIIKKINNNDLINQEDKKNGIEFLNYFKKLPKESREKDIISLRNDFIEYNRKKLEIKKPKP